ncbi:hypothetical protein C2E23DRAFT_837947 [Lenzites betulinus]|nr:hypothetical protein C2E23DRAFT_837947 [Lenzites betulinus]
MQPLLQDSGSTPSTPHQTTIERLEPNYAQGPGRHSGIHLEQQPSGPRPLPESPPRCSAAGDTDSSLGTSAGAAVSSSVRSNGNETERILTDDVQMPLRRFLGMSGAIPAAHVSSFERWGYLPPLPSTPPLLVPTSAFLSSATNCLICFTQPCTCSSFSPQHNDFYLTGYRGSSHDRPPSAGPSSSSLPLNSPRNRGTERRQRHRRTSVVKTSDYDHAETKHSDGFVQFPRLNTSRSRYEEAATAARAGGSNRQPASHQALLLSPANEAGPSSSRAVPTTLSAQHELGLGVVRRERARHRNMDGPLGVHSRVRKTVHTQHPTIHLPPPGELGETPRSPRPRDAASAADGRKRKRTSAARPTKPRKKSKSASTGDSIRSDAIDFIDEDAFIDIPQLEALVARDAHLLPPSRSFPVASHTWSMPYAGSSSVVDRSDIMPSETNTTGRDSGTVVDYSSFDSARADSPAPFDMILWAGTRLHRVGHDATDIHAALVNRVLSEGTSGMPYRLSSYSALDGALGFHIASPTHSS